MEVKLLLVTLACLTMARVEEGKAECVDKSLCSKVSFGKQLTCRMNIIQKYCPVMCDLCGKEKNTCPLIDVNKEEEGKLVVKFNAAANEFAWRLYKEARAAQKKSNGKVDNLIFSPASISLAVGMAMTGAKGDTKQQMLTTLAKGLGEEKMNSLFSWFMAQLNLKDKKYHLYTANAAYVDVKLNLLKEYVDAVADCFKSEAKLVDFAKNREEVKKSINEWVEKKTNQKIKELIKKLPAATKMVLVNAIYFKADWLRKFSRHGTTYEDKFYSDGVEEKSTTFMQQKGRFNYAEDAELNLQVVALPYEEEEVTMYMFLPRQKKGLVQLEGKLSGAKLEELIGKTKKELVSVTIPKFKIEQSLPLKQMLISMGMELPFSTSADFSGMTGDRQLYIGDALHKAMIEVNENGTEAAAATALIMTRTSLDLVRPKSFLANHPFMFGLRHKATNQWLFLGSINSL